VLELIRGAGIDLARLTAFPRVVALLRAIGDAEADYSDPNGGASAPTPQRETPLSC
jgi:hypothetical protein